MSKRVESNCATESAANAQSALPSFASLSLDPDPKHDLPIPEEIEAKRSRDGTEKMPNAKSLLVSKDYAGNYTYNYDGLSDLIKMDGDNKEWAKWYPASEESRGKTFQKIDISWTCLWPAKSGKSLYYNDPHWRRDEWKKLELNGEKMPRKESIQEERARFVGLVRASMEYVFKAPPPKDKWIENVGGLEKAQEAIRRDLDALSEYVQVSDDSENAKETHKSVLKLFGDSGVLKLKNLELPPGFLKFSDPRMPTPALLSNLAARKLPSEIKWRDQLLIGSPFKTLDAYDEENKGYLFRKEKTAINAWLTYLGYQTTGSSNETSQKAAAKNASEEEKQLADRNRAKRREITKPSENAEGDLQGGASSANDDTPAAQAEEDRDAPAAEYNKDPELEDIFDVIGM